MTETEKRLRNRIDNMQDEIDRLTAERDELADKMLVMAVRMESMDCLSSFDTDALERMARDLKKTYLKILAKGKEVV